jgi:hypothetical protein
MSPAAVLLDLRCALAPELESRVRSPRRARIRADLGQLTLFALSPAVLKADGRPDPVAIVQAYVDAGGDWVELVAAINTAADRGDHFVRRI